MDLSTRLFIYILLANTAYILLIIAIKFWRYNIKYIFQLLLYKIVVLLLIHKNFDSKISLSVATVGFLFLILIPYFLQKLIEKHFADHELKPLNSLTYYKSLLAWSDINYHMYICSNLANTANDWNSTLKAINNLNDLLCNDNILDKITKSFIALLLFKHRRYDELVKQVFDESKDLSEYNVDQLFLLIRSLLEISSFDNAIKLYLELEKRFSKDWYQLKDRFSDLILSRLVVFSFLGFLDLFENTSNVYKNIIQNYIPTYLYKYWHGYCLINSGYLERGIKIIDEVIQYLNNTHNENMQNYSTNTIDAIKSKLNFILENANFYNNKILPILENIRQRYRTTIIELITSTENTISSVENKRNRFTNLLISANCAIFFYTHFILKAEYDIIKFLLIGANNYYLVKIGEFYRLISYQFLHYGTLHIAVNIITLSIFGPVIETLLGSLKFSFLFIVSGIIGGILSNYFSNISNINISVGASASISGLVGSTLYLSIIGNNKIRKLLGEEILLGIIFIVIANFFIGIFEKNIDNYAHIGGFIAGFFLTFITVNKFQINLLMKKIIKTLLITLLTLTFYKAVIGYKNPKYFSKEFINKNYNLVKISNLNLFLPKFWNIKHKNKDKIIINGPFGESLEIYKLGLIDYQNLVQIIRTYCTNKQNSNSQKSNTNVNLVSCNLYKVEKKIPSTKKYFRIIWTHNIQNYIISELDFIISNQNNTYWLKFWLPTSKFELYKNLIYKIVKYIYLQNF